MLGDAASKPLVVRLDGNNVEEGRRILAEAEPPPGDGRRHHGRRGRQGRRARRTGGLRHGDLPHRRQQGHRPGHDRLGGHEAHPPHARLRHADRRRRQPEQGRHVGRRRRHRGARLRHRRRGDGGDRRRRQSSSSCRRRSPRPPSSRRSTREIPLAVVITEGIPVQDSAWFWQYARATAHPDHRPELPRPDQPRQVATPASSRRPSPTPGRIGLVCKCGHADLPDDVRAARHRLLDRRRHRRRPGHRHDAHRLPRRRSRTTRRPTRS